MTMTEMPLALVHTRAFEDAALDMHDGKLTGRLVPYDAPAWVHDTLPDGRPDIYREGFRRGAFDRLLRDPKANAGRLEFKHRHDGGLGYLGPGVELDDTDEGFVATFQIVRSLRDDVADLLAAGHRGLSIEFREMPEGTIEEDGVRWRTDVVLSGVALEWRGAYAEAEVLAFRAEVESDTAAQAAVEQAERERQQAADAEAAAEAAAEKERAEQAAEARRKQAEVGAWLAEQQAKQAELAARYK